MRQPELGRKITELRKSKGWTQEELVEKCNVSVRTIQRIETGEVTPRSYTIKTILAALDFDVDKISEFTEDNTTTPQPSGLKSFLLMEVDTERPASMSRALNIAAVSGIIYFAVGFLEGAAEYFRFTNGEMIFGKPAYIVIKIVMLVSYLFFQRAFILLGVLTKNHLLKSVSIIMMSIYVLLIGYDIASLFYDSIERVFVLGAMAFCYGVIGIAYGVSLRRLEPTFGRVAEIAGFSEIIAAVFYITIFGAFIGEFIAVPALLCEIIMLFKAIEMVKANRVFDNPVPA